MDESTHLKATREANFRRFRCCDKCYQPWSHWGVLGKDLPLSMQDGAFPDQLYRACNSCGNIKMQKGQP